MNTTLTPTPDDIAAAEAYISAGWLTCERRTTHPLGDAYLAGRMDGRAERTWRTMDTAPRDGTLFLAYSTKNKCHDLLRWAKGEKVPGGGKYAGSFESARGYGGIPVAYLTHWQPLPESPT